MHGARVVKRFQFLWTYASKWKRQIAFSIAALTFVSFTSLLYPWLVKHLVDQFSTGSAGDDTPQKLGLALIVVLITSTLLGYYQQTRMNALGILLRNDLRLALFRSLLNRPLSFYRENQVGELSAIATEEIAKVQPLFSQFLAPLYQNVLFALGSIALMLYLHWPATLFVLVVMLVPLPYVLRSSKRIPHLSAETQKSQGRAHAIFEESLVAIREIVGFLRERFELKRYSDVLRTGMKSELAGSSLRARISQAVYLLLSMVLLAVFFAGASKSLFPGWSVGGLIAFYFYAYMMTMAVITAERIYLTYQNIAGALDRLIRLLPPDEQEVQYAAVALSNPIRGKIQFENVSFAYTPGHDVLHDVSFSLEPGTWTLVTGPSGSGKSTLMNLIMGFYEPRHGRILIDDSQLDKSNVRMLRREIGFVGQDPLLLHGSFRENIAFTDANITDQQIQKAITIACLSDLIGELPDGLETVIGERGYTLSGGQKCRVAIARAILFQPAILLLDEANAMLEPDLERQLWANLIESRQGNTTLMLTHHPGNIPRIDMQLHLESGTICTMPQTRHPPKHESNLTTVR
jgi:ABC-type multidrug transport system fused ATPase/permease subunit